AQILVYKNLPGDVPGFAKLGERRKLFQQLKAQLHFVQSNTVEKATIGKGEFIVGDDLEKLLYWSSIPPERLAKSGLSLIRRKNNEGTVYFIDNRTDKTFNDWLRVKKKPSFGLFDPMTGESGIAQSRSDNEGNSDIFLQLQPYESVIIQTYNIKKAGKTF